MLFTITKLEEGPFLKQTRPLLFGIVLSLAVPFAVHAADQQRDVAGSPTAAVTDTLRYTDGVVKKVDVEAAKLTIKHGPLENLGMPAMTMVFRVANASWLGELKEGENIRFIADKVNGALTVVQLQAAQ